MLSGKIGDIPPCLVYTDETDPYSDFHRKRPLGKSDPSCQVPSLATLFVPHLGSIADSATLKYLREASDKIPLESGCGQFLA